MEPKSERKDKNALREDLASTGLPAKGSGHGCDVSTTSAQPQQPFIAVTTLKSRLQLALLNRKKGRNALEKGFTLVELMIVIVIVGILSAVALPNFLSQTSKAKATEAKTLGASALKEAQVAWTETGTAGLDIWLKAKAQNGQCPPNTEVFQFTCAYDASDSSKVIVTVTGEGLGGVGDLAAKTVVTTADVKSGGIVTTCGTAPGLPPCSSG